MARMRVAATAVAVLAFTSLSAAPVAWAAEVVPTGVVSWGSDSSRQLGDGDPNQNQPIPVAVDLSAVGAGPIVEMCGGFEHSLALDAEGALFGWGSDFFGQLGQGDDGGVTEYGIPVAIQVPAVIVGIDCGNKHSVALTADGRVLAWGQNSSGQLGDGTTQQREIATEAVLPAGSADVIAVSGGEEFSLALLADGTVLSWGRDDRGQLGQGIVWDAAVPSGDRIRPAPAVVPSSSFDGEGIVAISAGLGHSLAVTTSGAIWSWGRNNDGQLGDGSTADSNIPARVDTAAIAAAGQSVVGVTAGSFHSLALTAAGTLYSWGGNFVGALGDGTSEQRRTPVPVATGGGSALQGQTVVQVSAGTDYTLALTAAGRAVSWGGNDQGRLGAPSTNVVDNKSPLPNEVQRSGSAIGTQRVSVIGAGFEHGVAVTAVVVIAPLVVDDVGDAPVSRTFAVSGSGEPTATVALFDSDGVQLASGVVSVDGRWSLAPGNLEYGTATYTVRQSFPETPDDEVEVELTVAPAPLVLEASADDGGIVTVTGSGEPGAVVQVADENGEQLAFDDGTGGTTESFVVGTDGVIRLVLTARQDEGQRTLVVSQSAAGAPVQEVVLTVLVPGDPPAVDPPGPTAPGAVAPGVDRQRSPGDALDRDRRGALVRTGADVSTLWQIVGALSLGVGGTLVLLARRRRSVGVTTSAGTSRP